MNDHSIQGERGEDETDSHRRGCIDPLRGCSELGDSGVGPTGTWRSRAGRRACFGRSRTCAAAATRRNPGSFAGSFTRSRAGSGADCASSPCARTRTVTTSRAGTRGSGSGSSCSTGPCTECAGRTASARSSTRPRPGTDRAGRSADADACARSDSAGSDAGSPAGAGRHDSDAGYALTVDADGSVRDRYAGRPTSPGSRARSRRALRAATATAHDQCPRCEAAHAATRSSADHFQAGCSCTDCSCSGRSTCHCSG